MGRSTHAASYPAQLFTIAETIIEQRRPIVLNFHTEKEAQSFRLQWYGLLRALDRVEDFRAEQYRQVMLRVRGRTLEFLHRDEDPKLAIVNAALAAIKQETRTELGAEPSHTPAPPHDPYTAYAPPSNPLVQAQDTAAFEDAIEAWLSAPAPEPEHNLKEKE